MSESIAKILLDIQAVHLATDEDFIWTSGISSPIYCDNRQIMSYPDHRLTVARAFAQKIRQEYPQVEIIAGTATAGIPHAAWLAQEMNLPMIYVRSSSKGHGLQNLIEGKLEPGKRIILIEDMVSTGKSSVAAVKAIEEMGGTVLHTYSIFTYGLNKAQKAFSDIGHQYSALCTVDTLVNVAENNNIINSEQTQKVKKFIKDLD